MSTLRRTISRSLLAVALAATGVTVVVAAPAAVADQVCVPNGTVTLGPYTVPSGVTTYNATLYGQAGQDWFADEDTIAKGGRGMVMTGNITVAPGDQIVLGTIPGARGGFKAGQYHPGGPLNVDHRYDIEPSGADGGKGGDAEYIAKVVGSCQVPLLVSAGGGGAGGGTTNRLGGYGGAPDTVNGPQGGGDGGTNGQADGGGGHGAVSYNPCTINSGGCTGVGGARGHDDAPHCPSGVNGGSGGLFSGGVGADAVFDYGEDNTNSTTEAQCTSWGFGGGGGGAGYYYGGGGGGGTASGSVDAGSSGGGGGGSPYAGPGASITSISEIGPHTWTRQVNGNSPAIPESGGAVLQPPIFHRITDSTTTMTSSKSLSAQGEQVVFTVKVTPNAPDIALEGGYLGLTVYQNGGRTAITSTYPVAISTVGGVSTGTASIPLSNLPVGTSQVVPFYTGYTKNDTVRSSEGAFLTQEVRKPQTITFTSTVPAAAKALSATYTPTASATSNLGVTFSSTTSSTCSVNGAGVVSFLNPGTCTIAANQAGDGSWFSAPQVTQSINVAAIGGQTITFTSQPHSDPLATSDWYFPAATGGASGNPVTFSTKSQTNCSIDAGGKVTFTWGGDCVIYAHQDSGNGLSAGEATQTVHVYPASADVIFASSPPANLTIGQKYTVVVRTVPGDSVTLSAQGYDGAGGYKDNCAMGPTTKTTGTGGVTEWHADVTYTKTGQCDIFADAPANLPLWAEAQRHQFTAAQGLPQTPIRISTNPVARYGNTGQTVVTGGSGTGEVRFLSLTPDVCPTNSTGIWTFKVVGTCTFQVFKLGDDFYTSSNTLTQSYVVAKRSLLVTPVQQGVAAFGTVPTIKPSYGPFALDDDATDLTTEPTCVANTTTTTAIGSYPSTSTCSGGSSDKYTFTFAKGTVSITKPSVTVTASNVTKTYGAAAPTVTPMYSGLPDGVTSLPGVTCSANTTTTTAVGGYASTCSGDVGPNYDVTYVPGTSTVTPATLTVTPTQTSAAVYGDAAPTITPVYGGFVNNQNASVVTTAATCAANTTSTTAAGTYPTTSTCSGAGATNYTFAYPKGTVVIGQAPVTVTASNATKVYGAAVPSVTASYAGLRNGQTSLAGVTCSAHVLVDSAVGHYVTKCPGSTDPNYSVTYVAGDVSVTPAPLTITASDASGDYGSPASAVTPSYDGFVLNQGTGDLTGTVTCSSNTTASTPAGFYPSKSTCGGATSTNYAITYVPGKVTIASALLTVTAVQQGSASYGDPVAVVPSYSGFVNGEDEHALTSPPTCTSSTTPATPAGVYPARATCGGAVSGNYTIAYVAGPVTIGRAQVLVRVSSTSKSYGAAVPTPTVTYEGLKNNETSLGYSCTYNATASSPVNVYGASCTGTANPNYTVVLSNGSLTVTPAPLTITASNASGTYGGPASAVTPSYAGFVLNQGTAAVTTKPTCSSNTTATTGAGIHLSTSSCSGAVAPNYAVTYVNGQVTIAKKALQVKADNKARVFGVANPVRTATYTGFVNGENASALTGVPSLTTTATAASHPGSFPITAAAGTLTSSNYAFTFANGTLTVSKSPISLVVSPTSRATSVKDHTMTFTARATNPVTGAPAAGIVVTFKVTAASTKYTFGCSATTNASGVATCKNGNGNFLFVYAGTPIYATSATTTDYLAGSGTGAEVN